MSSFDTISPTFALISRIMKIDLPYQSEWFEYYDNLGIDHFYIYYIDDVFENLENILTYSPKNKITIKNIFIDSIESPNNVIKDFPFEINQKYVLHVDSDEFLFLNNLNLKQYVHKNNNVHYFKFKWLMAPSIQKFNSSLNDILKDNKSPKYFINSINKSMAIKNFIRFSHDPHEFVIINKHLLNIQLMDDAFIIHFSYRSIYDCFMKFNYQKLFNHIDINIDKKSFLSSNIKQFKIKNIPSRIMCFICEINNANKKENININLNIQSKTNLDYLFKLSKNFDLDIFCNRINKLLEINIFNNIIHNNFLLKNNIKNLCQNNELLINF